MNRTKAPFPSQTNEASHEDDRAKIIDKKVSKKVLICFETLGVSPQITSISELKKSFRKLALIYHPDKNMDDQEALERMQEINYAYSVALRYLTKSANETFHHHRKKSKNHHGCTSPEKQISLKNFKKMQRLTRIRELKRKKQKAMDKILKYRNQQEELNTLKQFHQTYIILSFMKVLLVETTLATLLEVYMKNQSSCQMFSVFNSYCRFTFIK
mmetsp:Transcript_13525/g.16112  ORF Transcript_13525/g.16112 Transcript_13525/m.16112 type:complete len:214 (-) Transcript_13525:112-753(-)